MSWRYEKKSGTYSKPVQSVAHAIKSAGRNRVLHIASGVEFCWKPNEGRGVIRIPNTDHGLDVCPDELRLWVKRQASNPYTVATHKIKDACEARWGDNLFKEWWEKTGMKWTATMLRSNGPRDWRILCPKTKSHPKCASTARPTTPA